MGKVEKVAAPISIFLPGRANIKSDYLCLYSHAVSSACLHLECAGPFINFPEHQRLFEYSGKDSMMGTHHVSS